MSSENQTKVNLRAREYEWVCPKCPGVVNIEIETVEQVTCRKCHRTYKVDEYHHAHA